MAVTISAESTCYYCSKCGTIYHESGKCTRCNELLLVDNPSLVTRICNKCDEHVNALYSYFEVPRTCPTCKEGTLVVRDALQEAPHFLLNGEWDGKRRGSVIKEKNELLRKKNAGYEHENPESIRNKTFKKYKERKEKGM